MLVRTVEDGVALERESPQPSANGGVAESLTALGRQDDAETPTGAPAIVIADDRGASPVAQSSRAVRGASDDVFGAFSLETFADVSGLTYTHEDTKGWFDYLGKFASSNFWYKDGNVKPWAYYEDYDNWQDTYGIDAVNAVYHSGHGTMDNNGVFSAPLGGNWGNLGTWVSSDRMRIGNEQANYIFWSTCLSLRVHDGQNPIRTWQPANLGFRMLFGFETTSVDSPDYGKFFWEEWNKNKSFSTAWMDASWRIAHDQAPSVVACGANQQEASSRVFNERLLYWDHVSSSWWWWRWYDAARSGRVAAPARRANLRIPGQIMSARLVPPSFTGDRLRSIIGGLGLPIRAPRNISASRGVAFVREGDAHVAMSADGSFAARFAEANRENRSALGAQRAMRAADDLARQIRVDADTEIVFDQVRLSNEAGGSGRGTGRVEGPYTTETTVQYRQLIDGIPVITPGAGTLVVSVDNDGRVTSVDSSLRSVERVTRSRPLSDPPEPGAETPARGPAPDHNDHLARAWGRRLSAMAARGPLPGNFSVVPGSVEVGYHVEGDRATLVAQQTVEVDFGFGLRKRYQVIAPLGE